MKYAILSDIHANLEALERVLEDARAQGTEAFVCLGDVVGYGPRPAETLACLRATCATILAGNHDDAVSGRGASAGFVDLAGDAIARHREALAAEDLAWLGNLPYTAEIEGAICTHGDLFDPPKFYYVEDEKDAAANFNATAAQLVFVGHTHVPCLFLTGRSGTIYRTAPQDFTLETGKRYIVNPGSVGYPREANGQCYSSYVLYDSAEHTVTYRFLPFSVASVMQRGTNPRRMRKLTLATIAGLAALLAALAAYALAPRTKTLAVTVAEDTARLVAKRELYLAPNHRAVSANLTLGKLSPPIDLRLTFLAADGETNAVEHCTVKRSSAREWKIPAGSRKALFEALRVRDGDRATIDGFAPAASGR